MAIPEGYKLLSRIGFDDRGNYSAANTYVAGDVVYYNGSTWVALKDNLKGVTPSPGANWKYMARGFAAELLADVTAKDTCGVLGTAGANVTSQALIDAIADRVMTKLLAKTNVTNNLLTTEAGYALDARQGKALKTLIDNTNSDLANSTFSIAPINKSISEGNTSDIFDWKSITVTGTYLLTCSIKKFDTTAADIQIFKNDETSPVKTGSNNVLIATLFLSAGDVIKIRAKSTKGTYTSYADQQFYFASLTFLSK